MVVRCCCLPNTITVRGGGGGEKHLWLNHIHGSSVCKLGPHAPRGPKLVSNSNLNVLSLIQYSAKLKVFSHASRWH